MRSTLGKRGLGVLLAAFFLALAVPAGLLIQQAHARLEWEALHRERTLAEELTARIDAELRALVDAEERRAFTDYGFLVLAGDPSANFVQRSPLSAFPVTSALPGIIGYFQLGPDGGLTTPVVPPDGSDATAYGITAPDLARRRALQQQIRAVLAGEPAPSVEQERLATARSSNDEAIIVQAARRPAPESEDLRAKIAFNAAPAQGRTAAAVAPGELADAMVEPSGKRTLAESADHDAFYQLDAAGARAVRKEQSVIPEPAPAANVRARFFESEVEPMAFARLDAAHLVLFRNVWRDGQRYVQGALLDRTDFIDRLLLEPFRSTTLAQSADMLVAPSADAERTGAPFYHARLSAPFGDLELSFTQRNLSLGPGADVIVWSAAILSVVLCGGFAALYRLGARQIELNRQQQDFVAAVSHELKTPLTSIRMYGEMLREGWADEAKKRSYYDFIFEESERLSRLIANVLRLSRMSHGGHDVALAPVTVAELMDNASSKVASHIQRAGFELEVERDPAADAVTVLADADGFCQVMINLVDNAVKFGANALPKVVVLGTQRQSDGTVLFTVRDYGPGVPKKQTKRIFELFYRGEGELTRETVGTGIGLALVRQLVGAMKGRVDVRNRDPGAEFQVFIPGAG